MATRIYRLNTGHAQMGTYLKPFPHRDDDECWWCGGGGSTAAQIWEHLFHHWRPWKDQQNALSTSVAKVTGWTAARFQQVHISEFCSVEKCDHAVMYFLVATEVGMSPPKSMEACSGNSG
jgi:hypothetical protein